MTIVLFSLLALLFPLSAVAAVNITLQVIVTSIVGEAVSRIDQKTISGFIGRLRFGLRALHLDFVITVWLLCFTSTERLTRRDYAQAGLRLSTILSRAHKRTTLHSRATASPLASKGASHLYLQSTVVAEPASGSSAVYFVSHYYPNSGRFEVSLDCVSCLN